MFRSVGFLQLIRVNPVAPIEVRRDGKPDAEVQRVINVFPAMQDLARRIIAIEAARAKAADTHVDEVVRACAKLQVPLSKFTGPAGFLSLLSRALVLATAEVPFLRVVQVRPDGSLAGFDEIKHDQESDALTGPADARGPLAGIPGNLHWRIPDAAPGV